MAKVVTDGEEIEDNQVSATLEVKKKKGSTNRVSLDSKTDRDDLVDLLAKSINADHKEAGKIAFTLDAQEDPSQIMDWITTGVVELDLAIANRPNAGIPCGRITEITGLEASGKSLLGAQFLAEVQKKGGVAVFIDTETSVSTVFLEAIGVDISKMLYINVDTVEDIFESIEKIVSKVRESDRNRLVGILVDSVAGASSKGEMAQEHGKAGFATEKAIAISKAMRKITGMIAKQRIALVFTNQLRVNVGAMFGDKYTTSGGKAIAFHASVRLRLSSLGRLTKAVGDKKLAIGIKTQAQVIKNRLGPPLKKAEFAIYFDRGIDGYSNWITLLKEYKLITGSGGKTPYKYVSLSGEIVEITKDVGAAFKANPILKEEIYQRLCEAYIMSYKTPDASVEDESELDIEVSDSED
jgi:recombination protein RecA